MRSGSSKITKGVGFQRGVYAFCRTFVGPFVNIILHIRYKPCKVRSRTFLCLGNHTQNLDPALMVIGTRRHMRFVANASLTRGIAGFFLNPLFGIIPREKGAKGDAAIASIEANLRAGVSVGMFPEGNRSWDGETEFISPRTAALVKDTGVALLTYRLTGGYLLRPRWADHKRKGPMYGELVHEYTPKELSRMTAEEVYEAICRDLYVNDCSMRPISARTACASVRYRPPETISPVTADFPPACLRPDGLRKEIICPLIIFPSGTASRSVGYTRIAGHCGGIQKSR